MAGGKTPEAANALRAAVYFPARRLLDWESKWHRKLLECDAEEYAKLKDRAEFEIADIREMVSGCAFEKEWDAIAQKTFQTVVSQRKAGKKYEDV